MISEADREILIKFGAHVKALRTAKDLSYRKLAQLCNIDFGNLRKIEDGEMNITLLTLLELAKGLGVAEQELLAFRSQKNDG